MDAIEPILTNPSILPEVRALQRGEPIHRDGDRRDGQGGQGRRRRPQDGVEVDVDGLDEDSGESDDATILAELPAAPHQVDLTADDDGEPPARRIDLSA